MRSSSSSMVLFAEWTCITIISLLDMTFSLMTLISNLKERNIKITDKISSAVVIAYGKTEPKGLKVLAS